MGYYTLFTLTWSEAPDRRVQPTCPHKPSAKAEFCSECGRSTIPESVDELVGDYIEEHVEFHYALSRDGSTSQSSKWRRYQEDLTTLSKDIPEVIFHLEGCGEEPGDLWDAFALNGKYQEHKAQIVRKEAPDSKKWR